MFGSMKDETLNSVKNQFRYGSL